MILFRRPAPPPAMSGSYARNHQSLIDKLLSQDEISSVPLNFPHESRAYTLIINNLHEIFFGKCVFCERKITLENSKLFYYRPVSHNVTRIPNYFWLGWQWSNMYLSCTDCWNYSQGNFPIAGRHSAPGKYRIDILNNEEFPLLLDPCLDNPSNHLRYGYSRLENVVLMHGITDRGRLTIDQFQLNRQELTIERDHQAEIFLESLQQIPQNQDAEKTSKQILALCEKTQAYAGMKRWLLEEYIQNNNHLFPNFNWEIIIDQLHSWKNEAIAIPDPFPIPLDLPTLNISLYDIPGIGHASTKSESQFNAYATALIKNYTPPTPLLIRTRYTVQAGIQAHIPEKFFKRPVRLPTDTAEVPIFITIHAEDMAIESKRVQSYLFRWDRTTPFVEFVLYPTQQGMKRIWVEFLYQNHWLTNVEFEVKVSESKAVPIE